MVTLPSFLVDVPRTPAIAVGVPVALGFIPGLVTRNSIDSWYDTLKKPVGEPPRAAFPIVWTALYAGMGYASHLLVKALDTSPRLAVRENAKTALTLHYAQLALNLVWSPLFFSAHQVELALVDILTLTGTVIGLTTVAAKVDERTLYAYVPYSLWLGYASYLNAGIWYKNGGKENVQRLLNSAEDKARQAEKKAKEFGREAESKGKEVKRDAEAKKDEKTQ
ncbi:uncharacterized protein L969DRAFT_18910 [Mixia osmundae IAM 14324]|uniref:TspO/MBR-related protein n=1 Tax=Mixia osmundae (strain CBS 9802 / IAM 14324 / JCM 22182 / KY 12970) TaxID=764103 RepID=G7DWW2_MIXOS|nr:uncharacterized protein L969DRAFT_106142 [Mixia osmundae IAM 14324]XP_014566408.1 uncharacterized protein L969DRAFT_18910 [Mixia osmundae IAM 14324]KEI36165.1 hypothetical protein L969DRAFT_106142 [Mixia osmundae IAM 14324]KEI38133.1 hypothetical protein L969DRAFT_18910 [Mixia osmundae IAM 14324]GAA95059.1 hypothetical protein E5Q_01714 [Mixia osmundae IAM 14324]